MPAEERQDAQASNLITIARLRLMPSIKYCPTAKVVILVVVAWNVRCSLKCGHN